jgi:DNA recombination protein RmuC
VIEALGLEIGLFCIGGLAGFLGAWVLRSREIGARDRALSGLTLMKGTLEVSLMSATSESSARAARLEEKAIQIADLELDLQQREGVAAANAGLREDVARLTAESQGLRLEVTEGDAEVETLKATTDEQRRAILDLKTETARITQELEAERRLAAEKLSLLQDAESKLRDAFRALSADALQSNNQSFLDLAKAQMGEFQKGAETGLDQRVKAIDDLVAPIRKSLEEVDTKIGAIEAARTEAYGALTNQLQSVGETQRQLHTETTNLVRALRTPSVRGRWGEIQLRRVVELAGMAEHCDFSEQPVVESADGKKRPDLTVHLAGGKEVIVDSKVPLEAYVKALEAPDEASRSILLHEHSRQVRDHMTKLAAKNYWIDFDQSPDHVIMFIPGEVFFFSALQHDPELIEFGITRNVFVAGPTTLISLLRSVAYGWRQELIAQNAQAISKNGRELYDRIATVVDHLRVLGKNLDRSVESYNQAIASIERRVLPSGRRFKELGATAGPEIGALKGVERLSLRFQSPELAAHDSAMGAGVPAAELVSAESALGDSNLDAAR